MSPNQDKVDGESPDDLIREWFINIGENPDPVYKEPILDFSSVSFLKDICNNCTQNTNVFILSIEVLEDYIRAKNLKNRKISDPVLAAVVTVFICHKCDGAEDEVLKIQNLIDVLYLYTHKWYNSSWILSMESDIFMSLGGKLPVTSKVDDLNVVIEKYVKESRLRANIRPLCVKILELIYVERKKWFGELKQMYEEDVDSGTVFQNLTKSKFYVPACILLSSLKVTHYRHILDIKGVITDIMNHTQIHEDHLAIFAAKIIDIINEQ